MTVAPIVCVPPLVAVPSPIVPPDLTKPVPVSAISDVVTIAIAAFRMNELLASSVSPGALPVIDAVSEHQLDVADIVVVMPLVFVVVETQISLNCSISSQSSLSR